MKERTIQWTYGISCCEVVKVDLANESWHYPYVRFRFIMRSSGKAWTYNSEIKELRQLWEF
jgi:hypothetical protein